MAKKLNVSPAGKLGFAHLNKPNTRFNADGTWSADLILEGQAAADFHAFLEEAAKAAQAELVSKDKKLAKYELSVPGKAEEDAEGSETGNTVFGFKNGAKGKNGKTGETFETKVDIVDAKKRPLVNPKLGRGSTVKIAYEIVPFAMASTKKIGVSLRLKAVQILELVEFGGGGASAFGEEEGYTSEDEAPAASSSMAPNTDF